MKDQMGYSYVITLMSPYGHGAFYYSHSACWWHFVGVCPVINHICFINPNTQYFTCRINFFSVLNTLLCILRQPSLSLAAVGIGSRGAQRIFCKWYRIFTWWKSMVPPCKWVWEPLIKSPNGTRTALFPRDFQKCYGNSAYLEVF